MRNKGNNSFVKNYYYAGKMLSADNMAIEQKYHEARRLMHNKYFYGCGIVTGLLATIKDKDNIFVDSGIAIDRNGREIVIDTPFTINISKLEGFDKNKTGKALLTLEYKSEKLNTSLAACDEKTIAEYTKSEYKLGLKYEAFIGEGIEASQDIDSKSLLSSFYEENNSKSFKHKFMDMNLEEFDKLYSGFEGIYIAILNIEKISSTHIVTAIHTSCRIYAAVPIKMEIFDRMAVSNSLLPAYRPLNPFYYDMEDSKEHINYLNIHTGTIKMDIPSLYSQEDTIISEEVSHGFGHSNVYVYIYKDNINEINSEYCENTIIYGSEELFKENREQLIIKESAVKVYKSRGSFKAALRLKEPVNKIYIVLKWFAIKLGD